MWALVFIITVALDIVWVWSYTALEEDNTVQSVLSSMVGSALVGSATIIYVDDNWLLIPEVVGNGVGILLALWIRRILSLLSLLKEKDAV